MRKRIKKMNPMEGRIALSYDPSQYWICDANNEPLYVVGIDSKMFKILRSNGVNVVKIASIDVKKSVTFLSSANIDKVGLQRGAKELEQRAVIRENSKVKLDVIHNGNLKHQYDKTSISFDNDYYRNDYAKVDNGIRIAVAKDEKNRAFKGCKKVGMQHKIAISYEVQLNEAKKQSGLKLTLGWEADNKRRIGKGLPPREFTDYTSALCKKKKRKQKY